MKIKVMVDKDNTHFSYKFECDYVIDGSTIGTTDNKLVVMKDNKAIAVFNCWTFWRTTD
jgi:hypothetical protein